MHTKLSLLRLSLLLLAVSVTAHADSFTVFNASGTFADGSILSGTMTFDSTTSRFIGVDLTTTAPNAHILEGLMGSLLCFSNSSIQACTFEAFSFIEQIPVDLVFYFQLPPTLGFAGYDGGPIVSLTDPLIFNFAPGEISGLQVGTSSFVALESGTLTDSSAVPPSVPEPSTLVLLLTGAAGAMPCARRRFTRFHNRNHKDNL